VAWTNLSDVPELPFANGSKTVTFFRQALALDERRARFVPEYWRMPDGEINIRSEIDDLERARGQHGDEDPVDLEELKSRLKQEYPREANLSGGRPVLKQKEVWFMGCHSDVGGGNDFNWESSLSHVPFRWVECPKPV
jgi:hypothetical protein